MEVKEIALIKQSIAIGDHKVIASGTVVIPTDQSLMTLSVQDLTFNFIFESDEGDSRMKLDGGGKILNLHLVNYVSSGGRGRTRDFLRVGTMGGAPLGLAFIVRTNKNKSRVCEYTLVKLNAVNKDLENGDE